MELMATMFPDTALIELDAEVLVVLGLFHRCIRVQNNPNNPNSFFDICGYRIQWEKDTVSVLVLDVMFNDCLIVSYSKILVTDAFPNQFETALHKEVIDPVQEKIFMFYAMMAK